MKPKPRIKSSKTLEHLLYGNENNEPDVVLYRDHGAGSVSDNPVVRNGYKYFRGQLWIENEKGVRIRKVVYGKTDDEVWRKLKKLKAQPVARLDAEKTSLSSYMETWLRSVKANQRVATYNQYEWAVHKWIVPSIGKAKLGRITPANLKAFLNELAEKKVGVPTRRVVHKVLYRAFNVATKEDLIIKNPMVAVDKPPPEKPHRYIFDLAESAKLLKAAKELHHYPLIFTALTTAMREGELFALEWADIDWNQRCIHIRHTLTQDTDRRLVRTEPKTRMSARRVDLDPLTIKVLRDLHKRSNTNTVFTAAKGGFIKRENFLKRDWYPLLEKAELPKVPFHSLRHVSNSLLARSGANLKVLQARLGHETSKTTFDIYTHLAPGDQRQAALAVGNLFSKALNGDKDGDKLISGNGVSKTRKAAKA